jgi:phosphoglycerate dehydrogenase-like enzyme
LKFTVLKAGKPEDIPAETWQRVEVLYTGHVLPAAEQAPNLRWVQFHYAGVDHVAGHPLLMRPGLTATTLSGAASPHVAEYIVMMLLALGHRLPDFLANQRKADWPKDRAERFSPVELRGCTVGFVGYGSIARQTARLLQPFGASILGAKRNAMQPADLDYTPDGLGDPGGDLAQRLYPAEALRGMIKECDFFVVTVPKTPATTNLITAAELAAFKPGAYLIDVSRGGVVNHQALVAALKEGKIAGAALDVFPEEPLPADSPLWKMPNVLLTPHIAGHSIHYDQRAGECFAANLHRYAGGLPLLNRVDPSKGY